MSSPSPSPSPSSSSASSASASSSTSAASASASASSARFVPTPPKLKNAGPKSGAQRRRSRAFRMSRESEIPSLKTSRFSSVSASASADILPSQNASTFSHSHGLSHSIIALLQPSHSSSSSSSSSSSLSEISGGDGHVSDVVNRRRRRRRRKPHLFELRNWIWNYNEAEEAEDDDDDSSSSSSPSSSSSSSSDSSDSSPSPSSSSPSSSSSQIHAHGDGVWELEAQILNEECKLLRVENELALLRWRKGLSSVKPDKTSPNDAQIAEIPSQPCGGDDDNGVVESIRREYRSMLSGPDTFVSGHDTLPRTLAEEEMSCKAVIRRMVDQMQAEAEQWSQVQSVLRDVHEEMESLHEARIAWEARAVRAESRLSSLKDSVYEWRCRARNAEERVSVLESEREAMRRKLRVMKHRHVSERTGWLEVIEKMKEGSVAASSPPESLAGARNPSRCVVVAEIDEEKPRPASVGTREDYALCESIAHSRNESTRSSLDFGGPGPGPGSSSQRSLHKMMKRSFDFDGNSTSSCRSAGSRAPRGGPSHPHHPRLGDHLDFCSRSSDVNVNVNPMPRVQLTRLEMIEPVFASKDTARNVLKNVAKDGSRYARLLAGRENMVPGYPSDMRVLVDAAHPQSLVGPSNSFQEKKGNGSEEPSRPKSVLAPRAPFGEIINNSMHRAPNNRSF